MEVARALHHKLGCPSLKDYKWVVMSNQIWDRPVTVADTEVASKIWGKDVAMLKGKTVKCKPSPVVKDLIKAPKEFIKLHQDVTSLPHILDATSVSATVTGQSQIWLLITTCLQSLSDG